MHKHLVRLGALSGVALLAACDDRLAVQNRNVVDVGAALQSPAGVQSILTKTFQGVFGIQHAALASIVPQMMNSAGESSASVANEGMGLRTGIPRQLIDNGLGNQTFVGNNRDYSGFQRFARQTSDALERLADSTFAANYTAASLARLKMIGYFTLGYAQGNVALVYDSASIIRPRATDTTFATPARVMANSLEMLDSAIAIASLPANSTLSISGAELINGTTLTMPDFVRMVRSYKARFRASVARTPAERAAVNWTAVEADAANGITRDLTVTLDPALGWTIGGTIGQLMVFGGWHQLPLLYYGMADTSGAYQGYIGVGSFAQARTGFLVQTPDNRWPKGATRAAQQSFQGTVIPAPGVYIRNRPTGADVNDNGNPWANSNYDYFRWRPINDANGTGTWILMDATEISMLRAEALIRLGRVSEAVPLINTSRVANGLPEIPGTNDVNTPVPGGIAGAPVIGSQACVPRVPVSATATACGNVLEAMKYEKRMETAFTGYSQWFFDGRGWGDLVAGTPIEWPVPIQEMNARGKTAYNGTRRQAAPSTYFF
jgi:hypothetical protein